MTVLLKSLPPIVQGADYARILQGVNEDGTVPTAAVPGPFLGTDVLTATVSLGQSLPSLFAPTVAWWSAPLTQFTLAISSAQSVLLAIDAAYLVEVFAARGSVRYPLAAAYLPVLPAAGVQVAAVPVDLVTLPIAAQLLAVLSLTEAQLEAIPTLISMASATVRRWCNDRDFDRRIYTEDFPVAPDGWIRLNQVPVNQLLRVQATPTSALTITNTSSAVQLARCYFATTGDVATSQVVTGLTLTWVSAGVATTQVITFNPGDTVAILAAAINAVGSGWTATAESTLASWPVTELIGGLIAQGCSGGSSAALAVFVDDLDDACFHPDDGQRTGLVRVGRQSRGNDPRWGPDWGEWSDQAPVGGTVRVTYDAGFITIPWPVQLATVELAKAALHRLGVDFTLASETAGAYSYTLMPLMKGLPLPILGELSAFRIANA